MATCIVDNQGRIVLPAKWRQEQGIAPGTEVMVLEEDGHLTIQTRAQGVRRAQAWVRQMVPAGVSLVNELITERRAETADEEAGKRRQAAVPGVAKKARQGKVA